MNSCACAARAAAMISVSAGVRPAVGDVLGDGAVEQKGLLQHDADVAAILLHRERAHVHAVHQDGAGADIVEAADEVDERALAGAARSHQADHLAGLDRQIQAVQHFARSVLEAHAAQLDLSLYGGLVSPRTATVTATLSSGTTERITPVTVAGPLPGPGPAVRHHADPADTGR